MKKSRMALCRGAVTLSMITAALIAVEITYVIFFVRDMTPCDMMICRDVIERMMEDTLASIVISIGGVLFYDFYFKHETRNDGV